MSFQRLKFVIRVARLRGARGGFSSVRSQTLDKGPVISSCSLPWYAARNIMQFAPTNSLLI